MIPFPIWIFFLLLYITQLVALFVYTTYSDEMKVGNVLFIRVNICEIDQCNIDKYTFIFSLFIPQKHLDLFW